MQAKTVNKDRLDAIKEIWTAYLSRDYETLQNLARKFSERYRENGKDIDNIQALLQCRLFLLTNNQIEADPMDYAETEALLEVYSEKRPDAAETVMCAGLKKLADILIGKNNVVEPANMLFEAKSLFDKGRKSFPGDFELTFLSGIFYNLMPESFGGGSKAAREYFEAALDDPQYGHLVKPIYARRYP
jgi:hypothetical protein